MYASRCLKYKTKALIMRKYIYLAGPIAGCTEEEATGWRDYVTSMLPY